MDALPMNAWRQALLESLLQDAVDGGRLGHGTPGAESLRSLLAEVGQLDGRTVLVKRDPDEVYREKVNADARRRPGQF